METWVKNKICVHCQKVFTCGYAYTDRWECPNYISKRMNEEEYQRKLDILKHKKEGN